MKFGDHLKQNIYTPWEDGYLQYNTLKHELKYRQLKCPWSEADELYFKGMVINELVKVDRFITDRTNDLNSQIQYFEHTTLQPMLCDRYGHPEKTQAPLMELLDTIYHLIDFICLNSIGFQKIIKKHDKWTSFNLQKVLIPQFQEHPLDSQRVNSAMTQISRLWDTLQSVDDVSSYDSTETYWIHPINLVEVRSILSFHLPMDTTTSSYRPTDAAMSTIYFDHPRDFSQYISCLQRDIGAESVRFQR